MEPLVQVPCRTVRRTAVVFPGPKGAPLGDILSKWHRPPPSVALACLPLLFPSHSSAQPGFRLFPTAPPTHLLSVSRSELRQPDMLEDRVRPRKPANHRLFRYRACGTH